MTRHPSLNPALEREKAVVHIVQMVVLQRAAGHAAHTAQRAAGKMLEKAFPEMLEKAFPEMAERLYDPVK